VHQMRSRLRSKEGCIGGKHCANVFLDLRPMSARHDGSPRLCKLPELPPRPLSTLCRCRRMHRCTNWNVHTKEFLARQSSWHPKGLQPQFPPLCCWHIPKPDSECRALDRVSVHSHDWFAQQGRVPKMSRWDIRSRSWKGKLYSMRRGFLPTQNWSNSVPSLSPKHVRRWHWEYKVHSMHQRRKQQCDHDGGMRTMSSWQRCHRRSSHVLLVPNRDLRTGGSHGLQRVPSGTIPAKSRLHIVRFLLAGKLLAS